jgi:hypothetical protein
MKHRVTPEQVAALPLSHCKKLKRWLYLIEDSLEVDYTAMLMLFTVMRNQPGRFKLKLTDAKTYQTETGWRVDVGIAASEEKELVDAFWNVLVELLWQSEATEKQEIFQ